MKVIAGFKGDYRWLSNFERCDILYKGILYKSSESAYQAQKTRDIKVRHIFSKLDARDSKALSKVIKLRDDWDEVKVSIMEEICRIKFNLPQFKSRLVATNNMEIIESNYWGDTFWGVCDGVGDNHLGKIIMKIRSEIKEELKFKKDA
jgi:ribA/ribD-fused uncharacterized protein